MICFPLDNTDYEAKDMGAYLGTRTRGVYSADANLAVSAGKGMAVSVAPGIAWLLRDTYWGTVVLQESAATLAIDAADGALARKDAIVARLDKVENAASLAIKKGSFAGTPEPPSPQRDSNMDEIFLAYVNVPAGAVEITAADIEDTRLDETVCGLMRDGVTGIPSAQLYAEARGKMDELSKTFQEWFASLVDILDKNTAGNLLNLINQNKADISALTPRVAAYALPASGWTVCTEYDGAAYSGGDLWQQQVEDSKVTAATCLTVLADNALARQMENDGASALWAETAAGAATFYVRVAALTADVTVTCLKQEVAAS